MKNLNGLIVSAGYSSRMNDFKPLMYYHEFPFILHILLKLGTVCDKICIVTGYRSEDIQEEIQMWLNRIPNSEWLTRMGIKPDIWQNLSQKIQFVFNPDYDKGMFTSLQTGLKALKNSEWILYHFVDQPILPTVFYHDFVKQINPGFHWIQPVYKGKKGHPIIIHNTLTTHLINAEPNKNQIGRASCRERV